MRRLLVATVCALAVFAVLVGMATAQLEPEFKLGFRLLADLIPSLVGVPLENEHHNPINGDALQQTSTGLMVWRKADNWTAFTDGYRSWINGPKGLQTRLNTERFDWETQEWRIHLQVTGGFSGLNRTVDVLSTGQVVVGDIRTGARNNNQTDPKTLREIAEDVSRLSIPSLTLLDSRCRDCFEYYLRVERGNQAFEYRFTDTRTPDTGLERLIANLMRLQSGSR